MKKLHFSLMINQYCLLVLLFIFSIFSIFILLFFAHSRMEKFCALESMDRISLELFAFSHFWEIYLIPPFLRKNYLVDFYNNYFGIREKSLYFGDPKITLYNLETVFLITELFVTLMIILISKLFPYPYT